MIAASALRSEATAILEGGGLRASLSRYGTVVVHGSYALDLMVWRDLDIYLVLTSLDVKPFFELGAELAELLDVHRMNFRNELVRSTEHLPRGLYWGIHGTWKIDIWGVDAAEAARLTEYESTVARELTAETRDAILRIKASVYTHSEYRRAFGAKDIYEAVLRASVRDLDGFAAYLSATGRAL